MGNTSKDSGFKTPEGYFDHLQDRILDHTAQVRNRRKDHRHGFRVPEGYFEGLADRLQERRKNKESKVRRLRPVNLSWIAAAAAAVLLLILVPDRGENSIEFKDLTGESIAEYLQTWEGDLSSDELADALPLNDIALEDILDASLQTQQIADYLENNTEADDELYWESDE